MEEKGDSSLKKRIVILIIMIFVTIMVLSNKNQQIAPHPLIFIGANSSRSSIIATGRSVKVVGEVKNSVTVMAGDVYVTGRVGKSVVVIGGTVVLMPTAAVGKNVVVLGGALQSAGGAKVSGKTIIAGAPTLSLPRLNYHRNFALQEGMSIPLLSAARLGPSATQLFRLLVNFILGGLTLILFPRQINAMVNAFRSNWVRLLLLGAVGYPALVVGGIIIAFTIIGLPLALLIFAVLAVGVLVGRVVVAVLLGRFIWDLFNQKTSSVVQLFLGLSVLVLVNQFSAIKNTVGVFIALIGIGAVIDFASAVKKNPLPPPMP